MTAAEHLWKAALASASVNCSCYYLDSFFVTGPTLSVLVNTPEPKRVSSKSKTHLPSLPASQARKLRTTSAVATSRATGSTLHFRCCCSVANSTPDSARSVIMAVGWSRGRARDCLCGRLRPPFSTTNCLSVGGFDSHLRCCSCHGSSFVIVSALSVVKW